MSFPGLDNEGNRAPHGGHWPKDHLSIGWSLEEELRLPGTLMSKDPALAPSACLLPGVGTAGAALAAGVREGV